MRVASASLRSHVDRQLQSSLESHGPQDPPKSAPATFQLLYAYSCHQTLCIWETDVVRLQLMGQVSSYVLECRFVGYSLTGDYSVSTWRGTISGSRSSDHLQNISLRRTHARASLIPRRFFAIQRKNTSGDPPIPFSFWCAGMLVHCSILIQLVT